VIANDVETHLLPTICALVLYDGCRISYRIAPRSGDCWLYLDGIDAPDAITSQTSYSPNDGFAQ